MTRLARWTGRRLPGPIPLGRPSADARHTAAYVLVGLLALAVTAALPFALVSLIDDPRRGHDWLAYSTVPSPDRAAAIRVNVDVSSIDVDEGNVTLRVTAALDCAPTCPDRARLDLFATTGGALAGADGDVAGADDPGARLPVIEVLEFSADPATVSKVVNLPISGEAIRYPFDRWTVRFNAVPLRVLPDGSKQEIAADDPRGRLAVRVENRIPRLRMAGRTFPARSPEGAAPISSLGLQLDFERPLYLRIVTVLLVVLIGAASAYAVFLRPLSELIINAGALVLGVWGIRAVLLGTELTFMTGVDLALMGVILFLLTMLTLRTLWGLEGRSRVRPLRGLARRWRDAAD
jgi:hypothetical protein